MTRGPIRLVDDPLLDPFLAQELCAFLRSEDVPGPLPSDRRAAVEAHVTAAVLALPTAAPFADAGNPAGSMSAGSVSTGSVGPASVGTVSAGSIGVGSASAGSVGTGLGSTLFGTLSLAKGALAWSAILTAGATVAYAVHAGVTSFAPSLRETPPLAPPTTTQQPWTAGTAVRDAGSLRASEPVTPAPRASVDAPAAGSPSPGSASVGSASVGSASVGSASVGAVQPQAAAAERAAQRAPSKMAVPTFSAREGVDLRDLDVEPGGTPRAATLRTTVPRATSKEHLHEEVTLLREVRAAIKSDVTRARELLRNYDTRFPQGRMRTEYELLEQRLAAPSAR